MTIEFRALDIGDIAILDNVADDVFDHELIPAQTARFLEDPSHFIVVAIDQGVVVGIGTANEYLHPDKPVQFWVQEMGVAPAWQRQGIGRRLLQMLLNIARERGLEEVWVGTEDDNLPARELYRSQGGAEESFVMYTFRSSEKD
jgi:aminoglycoside 6'-N-acetyltransferase I